MMIRVVSVLMRGVSGVLLCLSCLHSFALIKDGVKTTLAEQCTQALSDVNYGPPLQHLGWQPRSLKQCHGEFQPIHFPALNDTNPQTIHVQSSGPSLLSKKGVTVFQKEVVLTQGDHRLSADKVCVYGGGHGGISSANLFGDVRFVSPQGLLASDQAHWDVQNNTLRLRQLAYRLAYELQSDSVTGWGGAQEGRRDEQGRLQLTDATFSTCSVDRPSWQIHARRVQLDSKLGAGKVWGATLRWRDVPIAYLPYLSYPLSANRRSGFLAPAFSYSAKGGMGLSLPYYWNIAPNLDATITTQGEGKRGIVERLKGRFLTQRASGSLQLLYVPNDRAFMTFRQDQLNQYAPQAGSAGWSYNRLLRGHAERYGVQGGVDLNLGNDWNAHAQTKWVSDDYIPEDFPMWFGPLNNQLVSEVSLQRASQQSSVNLKWLSY